jgi:hypothetical protein
MMGTEWMIIGGVAALIVVVDRLQCRCGPHRSDSSSSSRLIPARRSRLRFKAVVQIHGFVDLGRVRTEHRFLTAVGSGCGDKLLAQRRRQR